VVHIQNDGGPEDPDAPFTSGWELVFERAPGEEVVRKNVCDAFEADKGLAERLRAEGVETVIVAGMQSQFCVTDTSLGALRAGFSVVVPHEAHATYDEGSREAVAVAQDVEQSLYSAGVSVMPLSEVELVR
jgi:nicotinamidase-related amidase